MSQGTKSQLYQELKAAGVTFDRHYREYNTAELQRGVDALRAQEGYAPPAPKPEPVAPQAHRHEQEPVAQAPGTPHLSAPADPLAAQNAYLSDAEAPLRVDPATGFVWFREEVRKPEVPRARPRRKLTYIDSGSTTRTVANGKYTETFEVAGDEHRVGEVRITMPSYQVGVYLDPRFPFRIHVYNENRGFDLFDVQKFYGGGDLVPPEIKRVYIENDLCYDIRTTVRAIQAEHRQNHLQGDYR